MIKVYDSDTNVFDNNGIKTLHPLRCDVHIEDNGEYYCELRDSIDNFDYYQQGMILRVPTFDGVQAFRIDNPEIDGNYVECKAWHISYDTRNLIIKDANAVDKNCNDALNHFNDATDTISPFYVWSDVDGLLSSRAVRRTFFDVIEWLASPEKYNGHLHRDNFRIGIVKTIGQDRGVVLSVGKNITDITVSEDWSEVCTKLLPYTTDGDVAIMLDETYLTVDKPLYDVAYTKIVEFKNPLKREDFESDEAFIQAIKDWLRATGNEYIEAHKMPKVNYSVSASIKNISGIGDTIRVRHPKCKVDILTSVISVVWDAIRQTYIKIEFGNFRNELKNLSDIITDEANKNTQEVVNKVDNKYNEITSKIIGVLGNSYVLNEGDKILVCDRLPKTEAKNVIRINSGGIGFSQNGINGNFNSAWAIDGTLDMNQIKVINLTASLIKGGTLKLGGANNQSGTFELYDQKGNLISLIDKDGIKVYALNGDYVQMNGDDGFVGYDSKGNKIFFADGETFHMRNAEVENEIQIANKIRFVPVDDAEHIGIGIVAL